VLTVVRNWREEKMTCEEREYQEWMQNFYHDLMEEDEQ